MRKLLVANRGEIAIRILRAAKELGIQTVGVYSEIDRDALHLTFADEAYLLGETAPAASYLNIGRILEVAKRGGADAIHPGYGFLAENPRFAEAVEDAGLVWVGPPPAAVRLMGDKVSARKAAAEVGVESVPGTDSPAPDAGEVAEFARSNGWPVAIKPAHGGGGRGFRVVRSAEESQAAFEGAQREAEQAFGSPDVYLEKYLEHPRHVEFQVVGDRHGNVVHLGERDCSLQRRHQKLIEEAPSPVVDAGLRDRMGEAAVRVAKAAAYYSAGTVEFLVEGGRFWFLEMNTRLQVEHPVTEMVTGLDLAKEMIAVASGEPLSIVQDEVEIRGHAIECRINAENPARKFLPSPGTIGDYREPSGPGVRVDSGVTGGSEIPQAYDSLVAKLICHGRDRKEAISRTLRALDEFAIGGLRTTIPFHRFALTSDWFRSGDFDTKTVESLDLNELDVAMAPADKKRVRSRRMVVEVEGKRFDVHLHETSPQRLKPKPPDLTKSARHAGVGEILAAPMQGTIVKTLVKVGDEIRAGDGIAVLEAMKMENLIACHRDGVVRELNVTAGETVQMGAPIASISPE